MTTQPFQKASEPAERFEHTEFWIAPTVLRRAAELNAHIENQLAIRAATALPFARSLARLGFVGA